MPLRSESNHKVVLNDFLLNLRDMSSFHQIPNWNFQCHQINFFDSPAPPESPPGCCSCGLAGGTRERGSLGQGRCTRAQGLNMRARELNMREQGQGQVHCMREQGQNMRAGQVQALGPCMRRNLQKVLLQRQRMRESLICHQMDSSSPANAKRL